MRRDHIPGLALLVLRGHRTIFAANYGMADVDRHSRVTARTRFEIASMTKQFTDAGILLLAERGDLTLADSLSGYFDSLPRDWHGMTLKQLMNHTAGLRDDWDEEDAFFTATATSQGFFDSLKTHSLVFAPGTDWSYSCGPFLLGLVIERITGQSYAGFMQRAVFEPLGLGSTQVNDVGPHSPDMARGYVWRDGILQAGARVSPAAHSRGDVGIQTTAQDLARWVVALDGSSLLSDSSRRLMFTPGTLSNGEVIAHGFGWFVTPFRGHTEIMHGGSFRTGFNSVIARYPADSLTIIILTNQFRARSSAMARAIASFYNSDYTPIEVMTSTPATSPGRTLIVTRLMEALRDGSSFGGLLPGVGRLGGWSRAELRHELAEATPPEFITCQDLTGRTATAFGTPIAVNCFYRTAGDKPRRWAVSLTPTDQIAYIELEQ